MAVLLDIQLVSEHDGIPEPEHMQRWLDAALKDRHPDAEVVVRIVDEQESRELNLRYRDQDKPTNVLSFPIEVPTAVQSEMEWKLLGDLVICAPVVASEAMQQGKSLEAHWAHMLIHGALHLCGYDHQNDVQANEMETLETEIITGLGFAPPYASESLASA